MYIAGRPISSGLSIAIKSPMKKIGVLRANGIGDVIITLPAFEAIKATFPGAEIVLLGRDKHAELFQSTVTPIDRMISLPHFINFDTPLADSPEVIEVIENLKSEGFDLIIQLHGGGRHSNSFVKKIEPRFSLGAQTPDAMALDKNVPYLQFQHEILRQLEIVSTMGATPVTYIPKIGIRDEDKGAALELLKQRYGKEKRFIFVNPGANDPKRRWPALSFTRVCNRLNEDDTIFLFNLGPGEEELRNEIYSHLSSECEADVINPSLRELTGVLANCELLLSNDTGTFHLAMALGVPSVALFWFRNLLNYGPVVSATTRVLVSWETRCPVCGINCIEGNCPHPHTLLASIDEEEVFKACRELITLRSQ